MSDGDLFAAVDALEEQHKQLGRNQGAVEGRRRQYRDGYGKGWQQACHVLQELGTLRGVVAGLLQEEGGERQAGGNSGEQQDFESDASSELRRVSEQLEGCNLRYSGSCDSLSKPHGTKIRASLEKLLAQLEDDELWLKFGTDSDEKLAQYLSSLQAKARFTLRKFSIPMHVIDRTPEADF